MNSGYRGGGGKQSLANSSLPCFFHPLKDSQPEELHSVEEKSVRIKRRRTRRERNYVKFGRNIATERVPGQRPSGKGLQKMLPPFWSSQLSTCIKQSVHTTKVTCGAKPIIITQNRLSQHLGMFNREVKSADIERLLSPRTEQQVMELTPLQRDSGLERQPAEELHPCKSCNDDQKCILSELGSGVKDLCEDKEDSFPAVVRTVPALIPKHYSVATVRAADAGSQPSAGPSAVEFGHQSETQTLETEMIESGAAIPNEKENVPPVTAVGAELCRGRSPVRQLAQDLEKLLDLKARFPGRNLISETRQAVIDALLDQKKTLPDFSALLLLKKLAGDCNRGTTGADFRSPADRGQGLPLELKSICSSRHSDQSASLKKRKGREQLFLTSPTLASSPAIRMAEERSSQREDLESFVQPEVFDQHNFYLAAVQPFAHLLSASAQPTNSASRSSFATEDQCPLQETLHRSTQQGLREALWESKSRQEKMETSARQLPKKNASKRHCLPFTLHDSLASVNLSVVGKGPDQFPLAGLQQYSCVYELSPEQWHFQETEFPSVPSLHHSQDLYDFQPLDLGFRNTERTASESQTSFDVLKSIWSPKVAGRGAKLPVSRALGYPCLTHQPPASRELNSEQGQPKEFFQLYSFIPQQHCSLDRQNPSQEVCAPSRHSQHGNGLFSAFAKPRTHCQKVSLDQGRTLNSYQLWGMTEAPARMQGSRDKGGPTHSLEKLLQMEGVQQLHVFQQLPMSYFPPSEALENKHSPLYTLQGQLLGQPSPEPWAFPRMKLY
ncbi:hypothetical protein lerEdw1_014846 [Lerista edwardsae]|nr:hypothetical protein lerEdw1_014846 [Lerista edwardsae]